MIKKIIGHRVEKKNNDIAKDGENVRISYVASTDAIDRYGDVVSQNWDLEGFKNNPVIYNYPRYTSDVFPNQPYFRERFYHRKKIFINNSGDI